MAEYEALNITAYKRLKHMILNSELEFNTLYSERKIADMLAISRTPVRDALVRLSQEHYIDVIPSKGFSLHKATEDELKDAMHFRLAVECYCARFIAQSGEISRREAAASLEKLLDLQRGVADRSHLKQFWQLDVQFHTYIVEYLNNPYFNSLYASINYLFTSLAADNFFSRKRHLTTLKEHGEMIQSMLAGDEEAACRIVKAHIEESSSIILQK